MSARDSLQNIIRRVLLFTLFPVVLIACATTPGKSTSESASPASKMYTEGKEALSADNYDLAISKFRSLEALYPADPYTQQAQMELAYAYHKNGDATSAIATAERFIKNYPTHANVDYAYYLRGLTSFEQAVDQLSSEPIQKTQRRPLMAQLSLQYLSELVDTFPDSKYSSDASRRIVFLKDKLAQYEVLLAKHFLEDEDYASAALHAKSAIENYPQAPAVTEAAAITNEAYKMLEITGSKVITTSAPDIRKNTTDTAMEDNLQASGTKPPVIIPFKAKETPGQGDEGNVISTTPPDTASTEDATAKNQPEVQKSAPSLSAETTAESADNIRQESWILAQDPANYTIQLLGTGNEKLLVVLIKRLNLVDKTAYYRNARLDKPWYALTYGTYSSISEANDAIDQLPADLLKGQPWIRKYSDIQSLIGDR